MLDFYAYFIKIIAVWYFFCNVGYEPKLENIRISLKKVTFRNDILRDYRKKDMQKVIDIRCTKKESEDIMTCL